MCGVVKPLRQRHRARIPAYAAQERIRRRRVWRCSPLVRMLTPYVADNEAANTSGDTVHYDTPQRAMITACAIGATVL
jgi:hypothetical protein